MLIHFMKNVTNYTMHVIQKLKNKNVINLILSITLKYLYIA